MSRGRVTVVAYRQDEQRDDGVWFSVELHLITGSSGSPRRNVLLREDCLCPDDRADVNVSDIQISPDGGQIAFTYLRQGVNRVAIASVDGGVREMNDGERPLWRPRS